jgi:hypothetical protein
MSNNSTKSRLKVAIAEKTCQLSLGNLQANLSKYITKLEPQWIYGLINVEEAASFEFAVLEDL